MAATSFRPCLKTATVFLYKNAQVPAPASRPARLSKLQKVLKPNLTIGTRGNSDDGIFSFGATNNLITENVIEFSENYNYDYPSIIQEIGLRFRFPGGILGHRLDVVGYMGPA